MKTFLTSSLIAGLLLICALEAKAGNVVTVGTPGFGVQVVNRPFFPFRNRTVVRIGGFGAGINPAFGYGGGIGFSGVGVGVGGYNGINPAFAGGYNNGYNNFNSFSSSNSYSAGAGGNFNQGLADPGLYNFNSFSGAGVGAGCTQQVVPGGVIVTNQFGHRFFFRR